MSETAARPRRLGLTGSIGAGKSTVAALLRARGLTVLDADAEARALGHDPDVLAEVTAQLGPQYVQDGALDRPALAALVFSDPPRREVLNRILHPRVRARMAAQEQAAAGRGEVWVVQDVPLLFEGGLDAQMDHVLVVDAPAEVRQQRVQARSGLSAEAFQARDAAQLSPAEKRARASAVLDNSGSQEALERQLDEALRQLGILPG
ncbi:dephospho-CoA kinase [Deinococcus sonorensis]|uniref:Dephospho-CoA kinase n=2 Tax=Deinococcus sonorensis TaxID=309891 RepID=A0AAU7U9B5_9DEIO